MKIKDLLNQTFNAAANSLTTLIQKKFSVQQKNILILDGDQFINRLEMNPEDYYFASILPIPKEFDFYVFLVISEQNGIALFDFLMGNPEGTTTDVNEDVISGVGELTNIIGHTFVNKVADLCGREIPAKPPVTTFDMLAAIMQGAVMIDDSANEEILYSESHLVSDNADFIVQFFIVSDALKIENICED